MMRSEFEERTGFEPTAEEYAEIEEEYYGFGGDKDAYCKQWKKNGGIQRLMRRRATRIEDLESHIAKMEREQEEYEKTTCDQITRMQEGFKNQKEEWNRTNENLRSERDRYEVWAKEEKARADEAERKLAVLKEAFAIITGKEEQE